MVVDDVVFVFVFVFWLVQIVVPVVVNNIQQFPLVPVASGLGFVLVGLLQEDVVRSILLDDVGANY